MLCVLTCVMVFEGASGTSDGAVKLNVGDFVIDDGVMEWDVMWLCGIECG